MEITIRIGVRWGCCWCDGYFTAPVYRAKELSSPREVLRHVNDHHRDVKLSLDTDSIVDACGTSHYFTLVEFAGERRQRNVMWFG